MAVPFLSSLVRIQKQDLQADATCMICFREYGQKCSETEDAEEAVRLPCGHEVGEKCIATWLSPSQEHKNTCPFCRRILIPNLPLHGDWLTVVEESSRDEWQEVFDMLLAIGYTCNSQGWQFDIERGADAVSDESLRRAANAFTQAQIERMRTNVGSQGLALILICTASALWSRHLRESVLYLQLQCLGHDLPPMEAPHYGLNEREEDDVLEIIDKLGAFDAYLELSSEGTKRSIWNTLRKGGLAYQFIRDPVDGEYVGDWFSS